MLSKACRGSNGITFRTADSRRRMRRQGPHPKPGFPQSGKSDKPWAFASSPNRAQTAPLTRPPSDEHLAPLAFRQFCPTPRADLMPPTVSPTGHLRLTPCSDPITPGHGSTSGNRWSPDTPRASAILANKPPRAHGPLQSLSAMVTLPTTDGARTHLGHLPSSPTNHLGLTARSGHFRQWWHFPKPMEPGHISGICHPRQQTTFGLTACSGHFRQWRHFPQPMEPGHTSGARGPTGPPSTGHSQPLPLLPSLPLPANSTLPLQQDAPLPS